MDSCNVRVGMKAKFDPFKDMMHCYGVEQLRNKKVTGKVVFVNRAHRWFSVEYGNGHRTSFSFNDIGTGQGKCVVLS